MGNFLVTIAPEQDSTDAELFQLGLRRMRQIKGQPLDSVVERNWARAAGVGPQIEGMEGVRLRGMCIHWRRVTLR